MKGYNYTTVTQDTITITIKVRIMPADEIEQQYLDSTMHTYKAACNFVSDYIDQTRCLVAPQVQKAVYHDLRSKYELKSQMACSVIKTVIARYKAIQTNENEWIKPNFRKPQYDLVWNRDYSITKDGLFSVSTTTKRLKTRYCTNDFIAPYFDKNIYKFGTAKLISKKGKYYLHIPVTFDITTPDATDIRNIVGIDRGINFIVATYDSNGKSGFVSGRRVKQKRAHYSNLRKQLQQRQTPSARRRLKAIGNRENRYMEDINHCISKALVANNPSGTLFVLEDLTGVRKATERVRVKDRYVSVSWAFYSLEQKLKYKVARAGSIVINVNPTYTSQRCPKCGHIEAANRNKRQHHFCCKACGYKSNDDRIGAMNLYLMGIDYVTKMSQGQAVPKDSTVTLW